MEAQLEYVHNAYMFFARLAPILHAQSVLISKISASELSRKFIESALLVGHSLLVSAKIWYANEDALVLVLLSLSLFLVVGGGGCCCLEMENNFQCLPSFPPPF